ncbi:unnamed protein product [Boreogadus saida]
MLNTEKPNMVMTINIHTLITKHRYHINRVSECVHTSLSVLLIPDVYPLITETAFATPLVRATASEQQHE